MRGKRYKITAFLCLLLSAVSIDGQTVKAGEVQNVTHVHDDICYIGMLHAAHGAECYRDVTVEKYCSGIFVRYSTKSNVCCTWYEMQFCCTNRNCSYYYEGDRNNYFTNAWYYTITGYGKRQPPYPDFPKLPLICEECGKTCVTRTVQDEKTYEEIVFCKCDKCGSIKKGDQRAVNVMWDHYYEPYYEGTIHGAYSVTEKQLVCTKDPGKYYDENGRVCECICRKIVTGIIPDQEEQILPPGDMPNARVTLSLYNGECVPGYICGISGYDGEDRSGKWQEVTLTVSEEEYPYVFTDGERRKEAAEVTIRVKNELPKHSLILNASEGGRIIRLPGGEEESTAVREGDEVRLLVQPYDGLFIDEIRVNGEAIAERPEGDMEISFTMPETDCTVSASFMRKNIDVFFDPKGGNWGGVTGNLERTAVYGKSYFAERVFPDDPSKAGFVFKGWYDKNGNRARPLDICTEEEKIYLFAEWEEYKNDVRYISFEDGIDYPEPMEIEGFTVDTESFWRFEELNNNGTGQALIKGSLAEIDGKISLYGHWEPKEYRISFEPGGGTIVGEIKSMMVRFHTMLKGLPDAFRDGYSFLGWFTDLKNGSKVSRNDSLTVAGDLTLYGKWERDDGNRSVTEVMLIDVNNGPVLERDPSGIPITEFGNRLGFYAGIELPDEAVPPYNIRLKSVYGMYGNSSEKIHILSVGRIGDRIVTFYEIGKDADDSLNFVLNGNGGTAVYMVLPHLSYVVREENYEDMLAYSDISTLSGREPFFEKDGFISMSLDMEVTDTNGRKWLRENAVTVLVRIKNSPS